MSGPSNAQLAAQVSDLLTRWNAREDQVQDWLGGTATGGPQGDGRYPLSDASGATRLVPCPAALASTASGPAEVASGHRDAAEDARDVALAEASRSEAQRVLADSAKAASIAARDLALQYRDRAANAEANAEVHRQYAEAARTGVAADLLVIAEDLEAAEAAAAAADADRVAAQAAAAAAAADRAALNTGQFATKANGLTEIAGLQAALSGKSAVGHTHAIADVTGLQAALDARLLTSGFTWAGLPGKPSTFAPSAHSHVIADVTGLQSALDAKLATSGFTWANLPGKPTEFAVAAHTHDASAITSGVFDVDRIPVLPSQVQQMSSGDLTALTTTQQNAIKSGTIVTTTDGSRYVYSGTGSKTLAASYVLLADVTPDWNTIAGKPSTFTPSAHVHAIADVTGLQTALDSKLASSSFTWSGLAGKPSTFAPSAHSHVIADVTGLQTALDAKLASASFTWSGLAGKPSTFAPSAHSHVIADTTGLQTALDAKFDKAPTDIGATADLNTYISPGFYHQPANNGALNGTNYPVALSGMLEVAAVPGRVYQRYTTYSTGEQYNRCLYNGSWFVWQKQVRGVELDTKLNISSFTWTNLSGKPTTLAGYGITDALSSSYVPTWASVSGKPTTFAPSAHSHVISDVTGLQSALDGKFTLAASNVTAGTIKSTNNANADGANFWVDTTNKTTAEYGFVVTRSGSRVGGIRLDGHGLFATAQVGQGATGIVYLGDQSVATAYLYWNGGSYAMPSGPLLVNGSQVWTAATFDPATKANASHTHVVADVTGLQAALDAKLASASFTWAGLSGKPSTFAPSAHTHAISEVTGLQTALDAKLASSSFTWSGLSGKPTILSFVAGVADTALDTAPDVGFTTVAYSGHSKALLSFNAAGSVGTVQQEFFYNTNTAGYWRVRNKLDSTTWQPWKHVLLHNDATAPLSGTIWTSTNFTPSSKLDTSAFTWAGLSGKPTTFTPATHTHVIADTTGLQTALDAKLATTTASIHSLRDFVNGTLVSTSLDYPQMSGPPIILEIDGNSYGTSVPFNTRFQAYVYNNTLTSAGGYSVGTTIPGIVALGVGGKLCFWWPRLSYWQGFVVKLYNATPGNHLTNLVTSITDVVKPTGVNEFNVSALIRTHWDSANFTPSSKLDTSAFTWAGLSGKPTTFTPAAHTHVIADTTGLQAALDAKLASSAFTWTGLAGKPDFPLYARGTGNASIRAVDSAGNVQVYLWGDADGQGFLNKDGAGYALRLSTTAAFVHGSAVWTAATFTPSSKLDTSAFTWAGLAGKPSTFAPSAHTHVIADTTGLQAALDTKAPLASPSFTGNASVAGTFTSGGVVTSGTSGGFQNATYVSGRNRIWSFGNADAFGLSYYQGTGGWSGQDTINFHFGDTAEGSTLHKFRADGVAAHAGDLYVKGSRLPVFTSSTGAPSGGVDGDIHITY